jgi:hypothetical protein
MPAFEYVVAEESKKFERIAENQGGNLGPQIRGSW